VRAHSTQSQAIKATEASPAAAEILPGPLDYEVSIPPVHFAWVRRVTDQNLWLYYRVREDVVYLLFVTSVPPVPVE
jgi:hypothetical protein